MSRPLNGKKVSGLQPFTGHEDWVRAVAFCPRGERDLSGSDDDTWKVWDPTDGEIIRNYTAHGGWVISIDVSPEGKLALTGARDKTLGLWRLEMPGSKSFYYFIQDELKS